MRDINTKEGGWIIDPPALFCINEAPAAAAGQGGGSADEQKRAEEEAITKVGQRIDKGKWGKR